VLRRALSEALLNSPIMHHIPGGPTVKAADLDDVREEFYKIYVVKDDLPKHDKQSRGKGQDARRQAFFRCVENAQHRNLIGASVTDSRRWSGSLPPNINTKSQPP